MKQLHINGLDVEISNEGSVYILEHYNTQDRLIADREATYRTGNDGHISVHIRNNYYKVSRLVAKAYLRGFRQSSRVIHIDGDPNNNRASNLRIEEVRLRNRKTAGELIGRAATANQVGITFQKKNRRNPYRLFIGQKLIGYFPNVGLAIAARDN